MTRAFRIKVLVALALLPAMPVFGQSIDESANRTHLFPYVADGGGFRSYIFLVNALHFPNKCTLEFVGEGIDSAVLQIHEAVTLVNASAEVEIDGAGASLTLASRGGQVLVSGYARMECIEPTVARMMLAAEHNGATSSLALQESVTAAASFQFPLPPHLDALGLILANDGLADAACSVMVNDASGASVGQAGISVLQQKNVIHFLDELVPISSSIEQGVITVSCDRTIAALAQPLGGSFFTMLSGTGLQENSTAESFHILPLVADGDGFQSQFLVTNLSNASNQCLLELHGTGLFTDRLSFATAGNGSPAQVVLSNSTLRLRLDGSSSQMSLFSTGGAGLAFGYATLSCGEPVNVSNLLTVSSGGNLAGMAAIPSVQPAKRFVFPVPPRLGDLALVLNNDSETGATCTVESRIHESGNAVSRSITVSPKSTEVRFLKDFYGFGGEIPDSVLAADCNIEVTALAVPLSGLVFSAIPPFVVQDESIATQGERISDSSMRLFRENLVTMPVEEGLTTETLNMSFYARRFYEYFRDAFDFLVLVSNVEEIEENQVARYYGRAHSVSNSVTGIGFPEFFNDTFGSSQRLQTLLHFPYLEGLERGPGLHEVMHTWGNYILPTVNRAHWGFSSVKGQLGGFDLADLQELGNGRYSAGDFGLVANYGNTVPYSAIELYLAGFIPSDEVPEIHYFSDGAWVEEDGERVLDDNGHPIFTGTPRTISIEQLISRHGSREPNWTQSRKLFRAATILIYNDEEPPGYDQLLSVSDQVNFFSHPGPDSSRNYNFHEATRGKGSIQMDDLSSFLLPSRRTSPSLIIEPNDNLMPEPHYHAH